MRTLQELVNTEDPGWPIVKEWVGVAKNKVEILPSERQQAEEALVNTQVSTRSIMGAVVYETGGLLIDNGWIRILGSGSERMKRTLPGWNLGKTFQKYGEAAPYLLVADDAIGGFFAINGGFFGKDAGNIYYFVPDMLQWTSLGVGYTDFLLFCFENDLDEFYKGLRWKGWKEDVAQLGGDYAYSFMPFLWSKEGKDIDKADRRVVPVKEVYDINMEMGTSLNGITVK